MIHAVWGTKHREPILTNDNRKILFDHIAENAKSKNIILFCIGGHLDHIHCLLALSKDQTIAKTIQLLKGESSNWANKRNIFPDKLIWAEDYFAASVSESSIHKVRNYIKNQEAHHSSVSFASEFEQFKRAHGFL